MEVFIHNLPISTNKDELNRYLEPILTSLSISQFHCHLLRSRGCAKLILPSIDAGNRFLAAHGDGPNGTGANTQLFLGGRPVRCIKSRNEPGSHVLQAFSITSSSPTLGGNPQRHERSLRTFECSMLYCGVWDYIGQDLVFVSHFKDKRDWTASFRKRSLRISTKSSSDYPQLDIPYSTVHSLTIGSSGQPSFTLSLSEVPRLSVSTTDNEVDRTGVSLDALIFSLSLLRSAPFKPSRKRVSGLDKRHEDVVSGCLVYRLLLKRSTNMIQAQALQEARGIPPSISHETLVVPCEKRFCTEILDLTVELALARKELPFRVRFQMQRLAQNGSLWPRRVQELLPTVIKVFHRSGERVTLEALRSLYHDIKFAGPETTADELSLESLSRLISKHEELIKHEASVLGGFQTESDQLVFIHKAMVTPTGIYLEGPHLETNNRILRKFSGQTDNFLRVMFVDENWEPCQFDRNASFQEIFHQRFQRVLDGVITIADLRFEFLGFSHSSLRNRSCWFMAPFVWNGETQLARKVIQGLGNFSVFRSPAKCAARIGQAFTDTTSSVPIPPGSVRLIDDVVRNGSTFSDGVGTISSSILELIWKSYGSSRPIKPTAFQIRHAGAKGMVALDRRLEGHALCLRPSMIKFEGSSDNDIEICRGARLMPLFLNRQYIKILEDLGVDENVFQRMQEQDVERLRQTASSARNAANFLERSSAVQATTLPYLLRRLEYIGFSFRTDKFLSNAVELRILIQLRQLKYRSRIWVEKGCTLYGIMDETNYLKENQVFCTFQAENTRKTVVTGRVVVTRPPTLHPGDIQVVEAVDVPQDSPLNDLSNCVVFSQQGARSLPSKLSGGDLDGDTFAVIYDADLSPKRIFEPAEYAPAQPVDIGRPVVREDMTRHFIRFMENDQLGRIANLHQLLADKSPLGTIDPACLKLADMHSTAVDFSKTGVQVNIDHLPKSRGRERPDFMATGPRAQIGNNIELIDEPDDAIDEDDDATPMMFYESRKVLGKLYRAIDEKKFLMEMRALSQVPGQDQGAGSSDNLLPAVWSYIEKKTTGYDWQQYRVWARHLRETYEANMIDIMSEFSLHPRHPPQELEVYIGALIDKDGKQTKRQREYSASLHERVERDVAYIVGQITRATEDKLERSIACVAVALEKEDMTGRKRKMRSWGWIAAAACLKQMEIAGMLA